jgi:transposase-like protein
MNAASISVTKQVGFGLKFAQEIRKNRAGQHSNWQWHLDEVFVKINGERFYLWRAALIALMLTFATQAGAECGNLCGKGR